MDADFIRLLSRHLSRCQQQYGHMLEHERMQSGTQHYDPMRIAFLEDALDDIEMITERLNKIGTQS